LTTEKKFSNLEPSGQLPDDASKRFPVARRKTEPARRKAVSASPVCPVGRTDAAAADPFRRSIWTSGAHSVVPASVAQRRIAESSSDAGGTSFFCDADVVAGAVESRRRKRHRKADPKARRPE